MRTRILGAAIAAIVLFVLAAPARADAVDLTDGQNKIRKPDGLETPWGEIPSDAELAATERTELKLAYDRASIGRDSFDPAQIVYVYLTDAYRNEYFNNGEKYGVSGYWPEAAQAFAQAAQSLEDADKQWALYKRMLAVSRTNNLRATMAAANDVLAADPKTYYFGPAQEMRARIYANTGDLKKATEALQAVLDAEGMNVRDLFSAKYLKAWLTYSTNAKSEADWKAAEKAYQDILNELERHPRRQLAQVPKFKTLMSLGEAQRALGKSAEARKIFEDIIKDANDSTDKSVLAGVYYGLGDLVFQEASKLQENAASDATREKVKELLDQAILHYLRVVLLYGENADARELFGANQGAARAFRAVFQLSGEKDCDAARKAYKYYRDAVGMLDQGEQKRLLVGEGLALKERISQVCDVPSDGEKKEGDTETENR